MTVFFLDAGHSGETIYGKYLTPGKRSYVPPSEGGIYEGPINRLIVEEILKRNAEMDYPLILQPVIGNCVMDISLKDRVEFVNSECKSLAKNGVDAALLSIHANASSGANKNNPWDDANGTVAFHYPKSARGTALSEYLIDSMLLRTNLNSRGVKSSKKLYLLRKTVCPSVILECGFMTNRQDCAFLRKRTGRSQIAEAVLNSLKSYEVHYNG